MDWTGIPAEEIRGRGEAEEEEAQTFEDQLDEMVCAVWTGVGEAAGRG